MSQSKRITLFALIIVLAVGGIIYRLFNLTFSRHADYVKTAKFQYNDPNARLSERGNIYFSDLSGTVHLAATNKPFTYVYSNNKEVKSAEEVAIHLAEVLSVEKDGILEKLKPQKEYVVVAESISEEQSDKINKMAIPGISIGKGIDRFYPNDFLASSVLGFVGFEGYDRVGQYGIEAFYDPILSGKDRTLNWLGNKTYSKISSLLPEFFKKEEGAKEIPEENNDIVLTIDKNIQKFIEPSLGLLLSKWQSPAGLIIVQDPKTGAILALASSPSFNPNHYENFGLDYFTNSATQKIFEPGSSFKPITIAAAIDKGVITPDTTYEDKGFISEAGFIIKNFDEKAYGIQTMRQVLEKSLNTGSIFAQERLGNDDFLNYVTAFGFGQNTNIDLPGEIHGNVSNLYSGRKINFMTASFGQGIAVTPMQLIVAYSAIANGGKLLQPYITKEVIKPDGSKAKTEPHVIGQPISDKTALQLKTMLTGVVDNGFDKARIAGYDVAGKTGTAQMSDQSGGYSDEFIHNFIGFAPSYNPRFVILIKIDKPKGESFASNTLTPTFAEITKFLLNYFEVPPTRK